MVNAWSKTLTRMRSLFERRAGTTPDDELLRRYVDQADPAALELLVWRHGLLVYNVCRQLLRCPHDADDAFQAVFLILARKARSIRHGAALAGWLHRVAVRVACEAHRQAKRQRRDGAAAVNELPDTNAPPPELGETQRLVHEALDRLPARFRMPLVLCYLEGKSNAEAAAELGVPEGTLFSRLARARERLRRRLESRGIALAAVGLGSAVASPDSALAALVPPTVSAALAFATRAVSMAPITEASVRLAKGVLHTMWLKTCTIACGSVLLAGVLGLTSWQWLQPAPAQESKAPPTVQQQAAADKVTIQIVELQKRKLEIAKRNHENWLKMMLIGQEKFSGFDCHWSKQWLDCERELHSDKIVAALEAHRQRIKTAYDAAKARFDAGNLPDRDIGIYEYALAEAELWLLRAKEKR